MVSELLSYATKCAGTGHGPRALSSGGHGETGGKTAASITNKVSRASAHLTFIGTSQLPSFTTNHFMVYAPPFNTILERSTQIFTNFNKLFMEYE